MASVSKNSFGTRGTLSVDGKSYEIFNLNALEKKGVGHVSKLPFSLRVLLENLLRMEDDRFVHSADIEALASWDPKAATQKEISFMPARVLLQDFTGVPAVVDFAAMREAIRTLGGDPKKVNPLLPAELVIDHSVQVDKFGSGHGLRVQRGTGIPTQRRTLRVSALGPKRLRTISRLFRPTRASAIR